MPEQRRLDRVLDPSYLDGLADRPVDEVSAMKTECTELETEVSFIRRLAQGRIDILDAERDRRASGGSLEDLIASLSKILAPPDPVAGPPAAADGTVARHRVDPGSRAAGG
jgi:hypothetical protein